MRIKSSGDAGKKCTRNERDHLILRCIDTHGLGCYLVVTDGKESLPIGRVDQVGNHKYHNCDDAEDPEEVGEFWNSDQPARAADELNILDDDADDFPQSEGGDCKVISLQPQGRDPD